MSFCMYDCIQHQDGLKKAGYIAIRFFFIVKSFLWQLIPHNEVEIYWKHYAWGWFLKFSLMKSITFKWIVDSCNVVPSACNTFFHQPATNSPTMSLLWESTHSKLLANSIKFPLYFSPRQHQLPSSYLYYLRSIACLPILREFMFLHHSTSTNIETTPYFATRTCNASKQ
jgi:hypothetical protein